MANQVKEQEMTEQTNEVLVDEAQAEQYLLLNVSDKGKAQIDNGIINPIELARALGVKNQQIYNYIRNGHIKARFNDTQKYVIDFVDAIEYSQKYLNNKAKRQAKIEAELQGE